MNYWMISIESKFWCPAAVLGLGHAFGMFSLMWCQQKMRLLKKFFVLSSPKMYIVLRSNTSSSEIGKKSIMEATPKYWLQFLYVTALMAYSTCLILLVCLLFGNVNNVVFILTRSLRMEVQYMNTVLMSIWMQTWSLIL